MARIPISDHLVALWSGSEATFGAGPATAPQPEHALRHISVDLPMPFARTVPVEDATGNRGRLPTIRGAYDPMAIRLSWPLRGFEAGDTTHPELHAILLAAGFEAQASGGAINYRRRLSDPTSAWIWAAASDGTVGAMYAGIACTELAMPSLGTDQARLEAGLQAARGAMVYATSLAASVTNSATTIQLPTGHGWVIAGCPAYIVVSDGEAAEVMRVTAVTDTTATVVRNVGGGGAEAFASGAQVRAYFPERKLPDLPPIGEVGGGFRIDDGGGIQGRQFTSASLTIQTGVDLLEKPALEAYRDGLFSQKYGEDGVALDVDVTYTVGSEGMAYLHRHADQGTHLQVECTIGTQTRNRLRVSLPMAQVTALDAPTAADGPRMGTINIRGFSEDGGDVVLTWE